MIENDGPCSCYCGDPECCGPNWAGSEYSPINPTCPIHEETKEAS